MATDIQMVPVPVPMELVPAVMRLVARHLDDDSLGDAVEDWGPQDPWASIAAGTDEYGYEAHLFWTSVVALDEERRLLRLLADLDGEFPASEVAERLGVDVRSLAGIVGPLNRRSSSGGFPPVVVSRAGMSGPPGHRRRIKILSITNGLRALVNANLDPPEATVEKVQPPRELPPNLKERVARRRAEALESGNQKENE